jgi:hypothetical protein
MDEMYHGGRRKNESGRMLAGNKGKLTTVVGVVERKGPDRGASATRLHRRY